MIKSKQSETTSIASGRLLRATELEDLTKFDEQTGFVSINIANNIQQKDNTRESNSLHPVTEDGRQLYWPKTVMKRPNIKSTSFRSSDPSTIGRMQHYQPQDRY